MAKRGLRAGQKRRGRWVSAPAGNCWVRGDVLCSQLARPFNRQLSHIPVMGATILELTLRYLRLWQWQAVLCVQTQWYVLLF